MSQAILEIIFKTVNNGQGGKAAAAELRELKGTVGEVSSGMLGLNLGSLSVAGAVLAAGSAASKAVTDYTAYATQIRELNSITGTGTEQTSRLVQAFDDLGISQETVTSVMETAARKGFVATIDNVAKLADKYNSLTDQQAKNKLMTDTLGKSGLALNKAMEAGSQTIRDRAANQEAGLIITEKDEAENEKLRIAQDNLDDSVKAVSNSFAKVLVPVLTELINSTQHATITTANMNSELAKIPPQQRAGAIAAAEYRQKLADLEQVSINATNAYTLMAQTSTSVVVPSLAEQGIASQNAADAMKNIMMGAAGATEEHLKMGSAINDLTAATTHLQDVQANWAKTAGTDVKSALEAAGVKGDKFNLAIAAIDTQMGTNFTQEQAYKDNITKLVDQYARYGDIGLFTAGLASTKTAFEKMDEQVIDAQKQVTDLQLRLDTLVSKSYVIGVSVVTGSSSSNPVPKPIPQGGPNSQGHANGGTYSVPSNYPNDSYPVWMSSGETYTVVNDRMRATGQGGGSGTTIQFNGPIHINNGMDLATFEARLTQVLRLRG